MKQMSDDYICTQLGEDNSAYLNALVPPIYMTSLHTFNSIDEYINNNANSGKFIYGRVSNPTVEIVERKINALERGGGAKLFASGMAAISSGILSAVSTGGHIICIKNVYGPAKTFIDSYLKKFDISCTYVKGNEIEEFEQAIQPNTQLIYLESPSSIVMSVQDLAAVAKLAKSKGIITMVDNTFSAGVYQKPLTLGIDMCAHTLSKYMGGHGDLIGGVLVCADDERMKKISKEERELLGGIIGPMEGWLVLRGLRTLTVRLRQVVDTSQKIARFLESHDKVDKVYYTGLPSHPQYELVKKQMTASAGLMSFTLKVSFEDTKKFVDRLKFFKVGVSWGGFENLANMPFGNYTPEQLEFAGAENKLVRICIGMDSAEELIEDLAQALKG